jgi:hypothetical protein
MELGEELERIAAAATAHAGEGEELAGVVAAEPVGGRRVYLCAFSGAGGHSWLAFDDEAEALSSRSLVRDAASIAALCELAEESAGGGDLEELRRQLRLLRVTENPPGIDRAEEAAHALELAIGAPPRVASPAFLDAVGVATRDLEVALGNPGPSPFSAAMQAGVTTVDEFVQDVERGYKVQLR